MSGFVSVHLDALADVDMKAKAERRSASKVKRGEVLVPQPAKAPLLYYSQIKSFHVSYGDIFPKKANLLATCTAAQLSMI